MVLLQGARRILVLHQSQIARSLTTSSRRLASHDDPIFHIGPWPRTKEERERAAKKYNLIPEDYQPFDEDEARGDYPNIPIVGQYNRDEYEDFDDVVDRRNYGEPLHVDWDLYQYHRLDPFDHLRPDNPKWMKWMILFGLAGFVPFMAWLDSHFNLHINQPFKQREAIKHQKLYEFPPGTTLPHHH